MMEDLRELYQEVILEHNRTPRNFREMEGADRVLEGFNPLCGDRYTFYLNLDGDTIREVSFTGSGCAISKASASIMCQELEGRSVEEAEARFRQFLDLVTGESEAGTLEELGKIAVFGGVREFPMRVKCATLPWHTLKGALEGVEEAVTTE
jgi:nitrogen fixation NifU-like protein